MKKHGMKIVSVALAMLLVLTACVSALAAGVNRSILHISQQDGSASNWVTGAMEGEGGIYVFLNGQGYKVLFYPDGAEEPVEYTQPENSDGIQNQEDGVSVTENTIGWFGWKGAVYQLYYRSIYTPGEEGGSSEIEGGLTRKLTYEDGKLVMGETDLPTLDWSSMIEDYGDWKGSRYLNQLLMLGDRLAGTTWDNNGNQLMICFDLTTGETEELDMPVSDGSSYAMIGDNAVLMLRYEWGDETTCTLIRYDLADESEEELSSLTAKSEEFGNISGLCVDEAKNTLYYVRNGEIWAAPGMDFSAAVAVNDCPISYDVNMKVMKDGNLLVYSQNAVMVRDVDPSLRADYSLNIQDYAYNETFTETVFDFSNATGVPVILRRGGSSASILQDMMNRDDSVDIYCMSAQTSEFSALKNRGFIYDLSGNEKLAAAAERLVPYIRDAVTKDGKLIAVPSNAYGYFLGYKTEIVQKLGIEDELPKTWSQFFDWIEALPGKMEGKGYTVFASWTTKWEFRYTLIHTIIDQYQMYINEGKKEFAFNTPQLRELLERAMSIDCDALGLRDSEESDETGGYWSEEEYKESLIETYTQTSMQTYNEGTAPLLLSFDEGEDPILPVTINVSFVNPFSKHAEEAAEFLAMSMKNLDTATRYSVFADETEPIRYPDFEEYKANMKQWYEDAKQALETADEETKEIWAQTVEDYEKSLADIDHSYWMVAPDAIAAYQSRIPYLRVQTDDLGTAMYVSQSEGSSYYQLVDNIANDQATVEELLTAIDKKVQMMRLEGN